MKNKNKELLYLYNHEDYIPQSINKKINDKVQYLQNWIKYETHSNRE